MKTKIVSVSTLRSDLKSILNIVQKGTLVIIESHGKTIAEIRPVNDAQKLAQLKLLDIGSRSILGDIESPVEDKWNFKL